MKRKRGARLGQHFLTGTWAATKLVDAADIRTNDVVLEIGPGKGALTHELLKTRARIVAIEKDEELIQELHETFSEEIAAKRLAILPGDVRDLDIEAAGLEDYVLAANIPYYITGEIIRQFLTARRQPRAIALLIQKEVADRILARDGKESILSISVKVYGAPEIAAKVSKGNFNPPPSVDSAILVVRDISKKNFRAVSEETFFRVVRAGFSSKRKFVAGNLAKEFGRDRVRTAMETMELSEKTRAEDISVAQWLRLAAILTDYSPSS